jgi:hypothetical protein
MVHSSLLPSTVHTTATPSMAGHPFDHRILALPPTSDGGTNSPQPRTQRLPSCGANRSLIRCFLTSRRQQIYAARALVRAGGSLQYHGEATVRPQSRPLQGKATIAALVVCAHDFLPRSMLACLTHEFMCLLALMAPSAVQKHNG